MYQKIINNKFMHIHIWICPIKFFFEDFYWEFYKEKTNDKDWKWVDYFFGPILLSVFK